MLGDVFPVQKLICGNRSLHWINVKVAVQVGLPVDGIPERKCWFKDVRFHLKPEN